MRGINSTILGERLTSKLSVISADARSQATLAREGLGNLAMSPGFRKMVAERGLGLAGTSIGGAGQIKVVDQCATMGYGISLAGQGGQVQSGAYVPQKEHEPQDSARASPLNLYQRSPSTALVRGSIYTQSRTIFKGITPSQQRVAVERIREELARRKKYYYRNKYLRQLKNTSHSKLVQSNSNDDDDDDVLVRRQAQGRHGAEELMHDLYRSSSPATRSNARSKESSKKRKSERRTEKVYVENQGVLYNLFKDQRGAGGPNQYIKTTDETMLLPKVDMGGSQYNEQFQGWAAQSHVSTKEAGTQAAGQEAQPGRNVPPAGWSKPQRNGNPTP